MNYQLIVHLGKGPPNPHAKRVYTVPVLFVVVEMYVSNDLTCYVDLASDEGVFGFFDGADEGFTLDGVEVSGVI